MTTIQGNTNTGPRNPDISTNVFYNLMLAVSAASAGVSKQQVADANTTISYGKLENAINNYWYGTDGQLQKDIAAITAAGTNTAGPNGTYQVHAAVAQQAASAADALMQQSNSQLSTDATNIQGINQLGATLNILGFIANLLAKG